MAAAAAAHGVPVLRPERVGDPEVVAELARYRPDLGVVVAFGQFLPRRVRELPSLGYLINAHASLLPRLRGAAPIARAILDGDTETGISVMRVEREMDAGPVALVRRTPIGAEEDAGGLETRLAALAADALAEALEQISEGRVAWTPQDEAGVSIAPRLDRSEARLDWREPADRLARRVRAFAPRPGATTGIDGEPLRVLAARAIAGAVDAAPGTLRIRDGGLRVATGDGWLELLVVQRAGRRALPVGEFLRGSPLADGIRLDSPQPSD